MTSPVKLLEYESLKAVLQHMKANLRLQLSQHCPSLQLVEKSLPLKIKHLKFKQNGTTINETSYKLGIYREYPPGQDVPAFIQKANDQGGVNKDLDEFGFTKDYNEVTLGDVDLRMRGAPEPREVDYYTRGARAEERLRICQRALALRLEMDALEERETVRILVQQLLDTVQGSPPQFYQFQLPNYRVPQMPLIWYIHHPNYRDRVAEEQENGNFGPNFQIPEDPDFRKVRIMASVHPTDSIRKKLEEAEDIWLPFSYRLANQRPPYTVLIQLTIRKGDGTLKIQRLPYVTKLQEALKKLNTVILEGRQLLVKVLDVDKNTQILRLPEGIKFKVDHLKLRTSALNIFWPILEPSSYPLNVLTLMETRPDQEAIISQSKIAREAQRLILHNHYYTFQLWARVLNNLPNQHVELKYEGREFDDDGFLGLVRNWLQDGRPVGTEFLFGIRQEASAREFLEMVQGVSGASRVEDRQINIPMDSGSMLRISYSQVLENIESLGFWTDEYATRWILKMEVGEPE